METYRLNFSFFFSLQQPLYLQYFTTGGRGKIYGTVSTITTMFLLISKMGEASVCQNISAKLVSEQLEQHMPKNELVT